MIARGSVLGVRGAFVEIRLAGATVGDGVVVELGARGRTGEVRAVEGGRAWVAMHGSTEGISSGANVVADAGVQRMVLGSALFGRSIDACGNPLDAGPPPHGRRAAVAPDGLTPGERSPVERAFWSGVRALDGLLLFGRGARVGIFGAPGSGKSTLLEAIVRGCDADAVVIALVGERGREAQRWIDGCDRRSTVVCATGDRPAAERVRCAHAAFAHAAALRERGLHVLLLLDSLARVAASLRELAVSAGESAGRGGYPPSVFAELARLVERAGCARGAGSMTLVATVLNDGEDRDPISEAARSLLDGHVQLAPRLAQAGRFPAIDVLQSASRTMPFVASPEHRRAAARVRAALALLEQTEEARSLGILAGDAFTARIVAAEPACEAFLRQGEERSAPARTLAALTELADSLEEPHGHL